MFNLLIVDDSADELHFIKEQLEQYIKAKNYYITIDVFLNEGVTQIDLNKYDAIFLDIDMPVINGFDLARTINEKNIKTKIIFVTNLDQLVYEAAHQSPFDFIRKSNLKKEFGSVVERLYETLKKENVSYKMTSGNKLVNIKYSQILYFEVVKNILYCHCLKKTYHETKTLKML